MERTLFYTQGIFQNVDLQGKLLLWSLSFCRGQNQPSEE